MAANPHARAQPDVVDASRQRVQPRLFHQQQRGGREDAAGEPDVVEACEHARGHDHEGRDLRGAVHVLPARGKIASRDDRDGAGAQNRRRRGDAQHPEPSAQTAQRAEHGEGPNAAETCGRPCGVAGPLSLEPHGGPAEDGDQQADQGVCGHRVGHPARQ
jgi:hypothetical protein